MVLSEKIRSIPDFPKPGIVFKDITPLIGDGAALKQTILEMKQKFQDEQIDKIVGIESRGFVFASILAYELGIGMVPVRKHGKLPFQTFRETYDLEYGTDALEIHVDALNKGQKVLIVDDLLATGGTVAATVRLIEKSGATVVGCCFLLELDFLLGRQKLAPYRIESLIHVAEEA